MENRVESSSRMGLQCFKMVEKLQLYKMDFENAVDRTYFSPSFFTTRILICRHLSKTVNGKLLEQTPL
jgi:hypothetical protein